MQHRDVDEAPARARWQARQGLAQPWIIGNDGRTLYYGPGFCNKSLNEQTGLVAHQVLHVALRHVARQQALLNQTGAVDSELFGVCADAIVNTSLAPLSWLSLPKGSVYLETLMTQVLGIEEPVERSLIHWDTESLYRAIDDRSATGRPTPKRQQSTAGHAGSEPEQRSGEGRTEYTDGPKSRAARQLAATMLRDLIPDDAASPELMAEQQQQWSERLLRAHAADGSQSLMRQLLADNQPPRTPWQHWLRSHLQRSLAQQTETNWSRPQRSWLANRGKTATGHRLPWEPGISYARRCARLCVMVDVSGSVDNALMQRFANEVDRMLRLYRAEVHLIVGDDTVRHQCTLRPGCQPLRNIEFHGGGGTDFAPLLEAASRYRPDIGVFLTDLDGPSPKPPNWPLIWAVPYSTQALMPPFGQRLLLD